MGWNRRRWDCGRHEDCWEGKRGRFRLLERGVRKIILGKWMGTAAACAAVVGLYVTDQPAWNTGVVALTVLAALYVMLDPVQEWDSLQGQRYYLTDRRAVMVDEDGGVYAMDLDELDGFSTVEVDGGTCLVLGSSIRDHRRTATVVWLSSPGGMPPGRTGWSTSWGWCFTDWRTWAAQWSVCTAGEGLHKEGTPEHLCSGSLLFTGV